MDEATACQNKTGVGEFCYARACAVFPKIARRFEIAGGWKDGTIAEMDNALLFNFTFFFKSGSDFHIENRGLSPMSPMLCPNALHLTVRGEPVEPPATGIKPFDKLRANGILIK